MREHEDGVDYQALVEQGPAVVYVGSTNEPGLIYISPQAKGMLGYAPKSGSPSPSCG